MWSEFRTALPIGFLRRATLASVAGHSASCLPELIPPLTAFRRFNHDQKRRPCKPPRTHFGGTRTLTDKPALPSRIAAGASPTISHSHSAPPIVLGGIRPRVPSPGPALSFSRCHLRWPIRNLSQRSSSRRRIISPTLNPIPLHRQLPLSKPPPTPMPAMDSRSSKLLRMRQLQRLFRMSSII